MCLMEMIFIKQVCKSVNQPIQTPMILYTNNIGAIGMCHNATTSGSIRHVDIMWHFIREWITKGWVIIKHVSTKFNVSDACNKNLNTEQHKNHSTNLITDWDLGRVLEWFYDSTRNKKYGSFCSVHNKQECFIYRDNHKMRGVAGSWVRLPSAPAFSGYPLSTISLISTIMCQQIKEQTQNFPGWKISKYSHTCSSSYQDNDDDNDSQQESQYGKDIISMSKMDYVKRSKQMVIHHLRSNISKILRTYWASTYHKISRKMSVRWNSIIHKLKNIKRSILAQIKIASKMQACPGRENQMMSYMLIQKMRSFLFMKFNQKP